MRTVLGIYQAIDPDHRLVPAVIREAFAIHEDNTIMGYSIIRATACKSTGSTSYGPAFHSELLLRKAEDSVSGYFNSSIEPDGQQWTLTVYERSSLAPIHTSTHPTANDALLAGRKLLEQLAHRSTIGKLQTGQWFSFAPNPDGTWSDCYQYMGNGWYGRAYSGGPWHKPADTQVHVLSDELQKLCNKQEQALIDLYCGERCEHTGMTRGELESLCGTGDHKEGWDDATLDASEWTKEQAIAYLDSHVELDDDYDRGHRAAIKHLHNIAEDETGEGYDEDWEQSLGSLPGMSEQRYRGYEGGYSDL